jgi:hypothetical protein
MHCAAQTHLPRLYLVGVPGPLGGASTKIVHLLRLLRADFKIKLLAPDTAVLRDKRVRQSLECEGIPCALVKDLPKQSEGVALAICDRDFFVCGRARELKARGLKVVWSNEMMWAFKGEAEAVKEGLIDRVLFVSEFQASAFAEMYRGVPSFITGNYIDPDDYCWRERTNPVFTLGRLSRADPKKYPLGFPVFYEELGLPEARYRVMAWSPEVARQYRWHRFGPEWELLPAQKEAALKFLYSLDVFLYPLGHRIKESWGRAVVEAMLTGAVPVVPAGHQFDKLMVHGGSGFICGGYGEWKATVRELFEYFIWLDADTGFVRNPVDVLGPLGRSPIHVPLETNLSALAEDHEWKGVSGFRLREVFHRAGLAEPVYFSRSAFWVVHHEAIEPVYELALRFWHQAREAGLKAGVDAALGYAMHLLCADTEAHLLAKHPELWGNDDGSRLGSAPTDSGARQLGRRPGSSVPPVLPAIIHLGRRSRAPGRPEPTPPTSVVAPCVVGDAPPVPAAQRQCS